MTDGATASLREAPSEAGTLRDLTPFVREEPRTGMHLLHLVVEGIHCGGCVARIERRLAREPDVEHARVNLTTRRLVVRWSGRIDRANELAEIVRRLGFEVAAYDPSRLRGADRRQERELLRSMAVAGFAAGNVMLLAISVWAGNATDMGPATRSLLHWFEALIALPAIAYAGQPFFRSAYRALRAGQTNMDVPISLAVLLAPAMSLVETIRGGTHVYFDSAVTLLFFLLIGRYLDSRARGAARSAAERLLALRSASVTLVRPDGTTRAALPEELEAGQEILVASGERIGADGIVSHGSSDIDTSAITGESLPQPVREGDRVFAGTLNLAAPIRVRVREAGEGTLLAEIVRLMELAEQKRGRHVALADRIARIYAPFVHSLAALTFAGWWLLAGAPWQQALLYATAVLIITCPCALGLAVPAVQVIASGRLMRRGTLLKSATALERAAEIDSVVFDKTGTLTEGQPKLVSRNLADADLKAAASLAKASRHPLARALAAAAPSVAAATGVVEVPGCGLLRSLPEGEWRLGRRGWACPDTGEPVEGPELWFARPGRKPVRFRFEDRIREDAAETVRSLRSQGMHVALLSGDRRAVVERVARQLDIADWQAELSPDRKVACLQEMTARGRRVMMVGDGLNDAPALAAAHLSMSPAHAVDISQTAADAVFQGRRLAPVLELRAIAIRARRLVRQNLALSFGYNLIAVPLAVAGHVTPLVAAIAMSASSLTVVGNAFRLQFMKLSDRG